MSSSTAAPSTGQTVDLPRLRVGNLVLVISSAMAGGTAAADPKVPLWGRLILTAIVAGVGWCLRKSAFEAGPPSSPTPQPAPPPAIPQQAAR
jgi:hypothetical protein